MGSWSWKSSRRTLSSSWKRSMGAFYRMWGGSSENVGALESAHMQKKPGARFNAYDDLFSIQKYNDETLVDLAVRIEHVHYGTASCLISSHLINHVSPILSNELSTLQFGCYRTALYLIFYILSLFGLVDIIIRFDSCLALLHTADSMPSHYFILLSLKPYPYSAKLYFYTAISLYVLSFTPYLLIFLSLTHPIAGSYPMEDIWTIFYWMISLG